MKLSFIQITNSSDQCSALNHGLLSPPFSLSILMAARFVKDCVWCFSFFICSFIYQRIFWLIVSIIFTVWIILPLFILYTTKYVIIFIISTLYLFLVTQIIWCLLLECRFSSTTFAFPFFFFPKILLLNLYFVDSGKHWRDSWYW